MESQELRPANEHLRQFLLTHHRLWPPRSLAGKPGILDFIEHVGCIQYDPINVVGRNPDLVLQARIGDYRHGFLDELLYQDRLLLDGWDKLASIHLTQDWPYFSRHRNMMKTHYSASLEPAMAVAPLVRQEIAQRGPLSSLDFDHKESIDWVWGRPGRQVRAAMDLLYAMGELGIHRRANTRRYFDLIERLLPADLLAAPDPNPGEQEYQDWHVLRRVGSMGLANPRAVETWLGIYGVKTPQRRAALDRLVSAGKLARVILEGGTQRELFLRSVDLPVYHEAQEARLPNHRAAFMAPLDNMLWDRDLLRWIFDFDYIWEVYKPAEQRAYGYYVLPVLYGDRFVARVDARYDRKSGRLIIRNWWWEAGVRPDLAMGTALTECLSEFVRYLGAQELILEPSGKGVNELGEILGIQPGK
jgi:uncharacterized protein